MTSSNQRPDTLTKNVGRGPPWSDRVVISNKELTAQQPPLRSSLRRTFPGLCSVSSAPTLKQVDRHEVELKKNTSSTSFTGNHVRGDPEAGCARRSINRTYQPKIGRAHNLSEGQ